MNGRHPARLDDWVADLHQALSVDPSAHFENRVRAHVVAAGPSRRSLSVARACVVLVAAASAIGIGTAMSWVGRASSAMPSVAAAMPPHSTFTAIRFSGATDIRDAAPGRRAMRSAPASAAAAGPSSSGVFEVLVPPDQANALRRLLAAMASGRSVVPARATLADAEAGEMLEPEPIEIRRLPEIAPIGARDTAHGRAR